LTFPPLGTRSTGVSLLRDPLCPSLPPQREPFRVLRPYEFTGERCRWNLCVHAGRDPIDVPVSFCISFLSSRRRVPPRCSALTLKAATFFARPVCVFSPPSYVEFFCRERRFNLPSRPTGPQSLGCKPPTRTVPFSSAGTESRRLAPNFRRKRLSVILSLV